MSPQKSDFGRARSISTLEPFDADELGRMIAYRLSVAGRERPLFTPAALAALYDLSDGIPRTAINLCEYALEVAFANEADTVDEMHMRRATDGVERGRLRAARGASAAPLLAGTGGLP